MVTGIPYPRFVLGRWLGTGSLGTVYAAEMRGDGAQPRKVALKILHARMATEENLYTLRERIQTIEYPSSAVVPVTGPVALDGGHWALVMDLVQGVDLRRLRAQEGVIPTSIAIQIVRRLAQILVLCRRMRHESPSVHGHLQLSNVMMSADAEVSLLDFGLGPVERPNETTSSGIGPDLAGYLAPEQWDGLAYPASDVYALGALLYELLMGRSLPRSSSNPDVHQQRIGGVIQGLGDLSSGDTHALTALLRGLLLHDPGERLQLEEVVSSCDAMLASTTFLRLEAWAVEAVPQALGQAPSPVGLPLPSGTTLGRTAPEEDLITRPGVARGASARHAALDDDLDDDTLPEPVGSPHEDESTDPSGDRAALQATPEDDTDGDPDDAQDLGEQLTVIARHPHLPPPSPPRARPIEDSPRVATTRSVDPYEDDRSESEGAGRGPLVLLAFIALAGAGLGVAWFVGRPADPVPVDPVVADTIAADPMPADPIAADPIVADPAAEAPAAEAPAAEAPPVPVAAAEEPPPVEATAPPATARRSPPKPRRPEPKPAVTTTPPMPVEAKVSVSAQGATQVALDGPGGRFVLPAKVPPGAYTVLATFPGEDPLTRAGTLTVSEGNAVTLRCDDSFLLCSP